MLPLYCTKDKELIEEDETPTSNHNYYLLIDRSISRDIGEL